MTCLTPMEDCVRAALAGYDRIEAVLHFASDPAINVGDRDAFVAYINGQLTGHWKASTGLRAPDAAPNFGYVNGALHVSTRGREALGIMAFLAHLSGRPFDEQDPDEFAGWLSACQALRHGTKPNRHDLAPNGTEAASLQRGHYRYCVARFGVNQAYAYATWPGHHNARVYPVRLSSWTHINTILATRAQNPRTRCLFVLSLSPMQDNELWTIRRGQFYKENQRLYVKLPKTKSVPTERIYQIIVAPAIVEDYLKEIGEEPTKLLFEDPANPGQPQPNLHSIISSLGDNIGPISRERLRNTILATLLNIDGDIDAWLLSMMGTRDLQHVRRIQNFLENNPQVGKELLLPIQFGPTFDTHYCPAGHANRAGDRTCKVCLRVLQLDALTPQGMAKAALVRLVIQLYDKGLAPDELAKLAVTEVQP